MNFLRPTVLGFGVFIVFPSLLLAQPDASKWESPRYYLEKFDPAFADRIQITEFTVRPEDSKPYNPSPGGGYGYYWTDWSNTEQLELNLFETKNFKFHRFTFHDTYANIRPRFRWINENLFFVRVFWEKTLGTDLIIDMETGTVIYKEMLYDGTSLFMQTRGAVEPPEKVEKQIAILRKRLTPTLESSQAEIKNVYGKGRIREASKGFFVQYIRLSSEVSLTLQYQGQKLMEAPWLGHGPKANRGGGGDPGTGEYLSGQWITQQTNLMILDELREVEESYHDRLNEASWNKIEVGDQK